MHSGVPECCSTDSHILEGQLIVGVALEETGTAAEGGFPYGFDLLDAVDSRQGCASAECVTVYDEPAVARAVALDCQGSEGRASSERIGRDVSTVIPAVHPTESFGNGNGRDPGIILERGKPGHLDQHDSVVGRYPEQCVGMDLVLVIDGDR